ncbi:sensor histidine kinase [Larkinella sp. GY13]|uniref:sensor histidine kinase n=1 Tax=Larkinella sp. GY13 TaxID=3453720 RepID=UPI003EE8AA51
MMVRKKRSVVLLSLSLTSLVLYWGYRLYESSWQQEAMGPNLAGLARYIAGILMLLICILVMAHLNYRWVFRHWARERSTGLNYWSWICLLAWILFELLQLRTDQEASFVDENLLVTLLILAGLVGYGFVADGVRTRSEQADLLQQKTEAELTALKAQINPHFLFNALNTIFNEAQKAHNHKIADLIQQLSGIMRFTLLESTQSLTSIENEFEFLTKYLALQRARLPETEAIRVTTLLDWDGEPAQIAPLLLIPFVENAFQYGISFAQPSFIDLAIRVENQRLCMRLENSVPTLNLRHLSTGTGIATARRRLELMYSGCHRLEIARADHTFLVELTLDL